MGEIKTIIDRSNDLTINTATGKISIDDIITTVKEYLSQTPTSRVLWNFSEADGSGITSDDFRQLHSTVRELPGASEKRRIAIVISSEFGYGLSRQSETYAEISGVQAEYHIARTLEEAMSWLKRPMGEDDIKT